MTISYSEADESLLLAFFNRLKVKVKKEVDTDDDEGVPLEVAYDIIDGLKQIEQYERGELKPPSWDEMMAELRADEKEAETA